MRAEQIALVQATFSRLTLHEKPFADLFYYRLFALDPSTRRLFAGDLRLQKHALTSMLRLMIDGLSHPDALGPLLHDLGERHRSYGVLDADYDTVGTALTWAIEQALDLDFSSANRAAWAAAYQLFANTMRSATQPSAVNFSPGKTSAS